MSRTTESLPPRRVRFIYFSRLKRLPVPACLPDVVLQEGWERSFAYWILAKYSFKNSTIYNFSLRRLGEVLNISHEAARFHYKVWEKQGLVRIHSGNLTFLGWKSMLPIASRSHEKRYYRRICLLVHDNLSDQISNIQTRAILKNINQQIRNFNVKRETTEKLGLAKRKKYLTRDEVKEYKSALRVSKTFKNPEIFNEEVYLSDRSIARLVGASVSHAKKLRSYIRKYDILNLDVLKGRMVGDRMGKQEYYLRKEVDSRFSDTFYWNGYAYSYPKTVIHAGTCVNMGLLKSQALSTGLKS